METEGFFAQNTLFTRDEWLAFRQNRETTQSSADQLLKYYVAKKRLVRVRKELYAVVAPGSDAAFVDVDPFVVCMKVVPDAVVAYHAALEFHGHAYSLHQEFAFLTEKHMASFHFQDIKFRPVQPSKALLRQNAWQMETLNRERGMQIVRVTSLERTLVDCLDRVDLAGGWEEVWRSLASSSYYEMDRVVTYVGKLGNATTAAKVGFFLEQNQEALRVPESILQELERLRPRQKHYIDSIRTPGKLVSRWNLIVPPEVLNQTWGAVL